jgi:hypothetical protein
MEAINPFFGGAHADLLSVLPFLALMALLFRSGTRKAPGA